MNGVMWNGRAWLKPVREMPSLAHQGRLRHGQPDSLTEGQEIGVVGRDAPIEAERVALWRSARAEIEP